jgi:hypothetical protein
VLKKVLFAALVVASTVVAGLFAASPAQAASPYGCNYPRVCFYKNVDSLLKNRPNAAFRDITPGFQKLGSRSKGAAYIISTRRDDTVYIHFTNGRVTCLAPRGSLFTHYYGVADKIRISSSPRCRG